MTIVISRRKVLEWYITGDLNDIKNIDEIIDEMKFGLNKKVIILESENKDRVIVK